MTIERVDITTLQLDPANVRRHGDRNLKAIQASLTKFGQQKPIVVDAKGVVVAGNGTLEAARALGWTEIDVVRSDLHGAEAVAYAIADNRTAELAEWDFEALSQQMRGLVDEDFGMDALGWAEHELEPLLAADWSPPAVSELPGGESGATGKPIKLTAEQREVVDRAIANVRQSRDDETLSDGACVAALCEEYLARVCWIFDWPIAVPRRVWRRGWFRRMRGNRPCWSPTPIWGRSCRTGTDTRIAIGPWIVARLAPTTAGG